MATPKDAKTVIKRKWIKITEEMTNLNKYPSTKFIKNNQKILYF